MPNRTWQDVAIVGIVCVTFLGVTYMTANNFDSTEWRDTGLTGMLAGTGVAVGRPLFKLVRVVWKAIIDSYTGGEL